MALTLKQDFTQSTLATAAKVGPTLTFARSSSATYFDSSGTLQTASSGTARLASHTYNGTSWVNRGVLIEEARTNECLRSEEIDNASWVSGGSASTITADDAVAPDGNTTADKVDDTNAGAYSYRFQTMSGVAANSETWTASVYILKDAIAKTTRYALVRMRFTGGTTTGGELYIATDDGEIASGVQTGSGTVAATGIDDVGDYWRAWIAFTNDASGNTNAQIEIHPAPAANATLGNGFSATITGAITVWGMQVEKGAFPTSYIPTTTASVTRNEDNLTTTDFSWLDANPTAVGSFVVEYMIPNDLGQDSYVLELDDGSASDRVFIFSFGDAPAFWISTSVGNSGTMSSLGTYSYGTSHEMAVAWADNDCAASFDGASVTTDTVFDGLADASTLFTVGDYPYAANREINGFIKHLRYYDERLANDILENPPPFDARPMLMLMGVGR